ncbi:MAG: phospho-sugar mutase [Chitinophagaceae bacterium]|nr:phospho-sugar mutase [Chitinophagaceae bacterium]
MEQVALKQAEKWIYSKNVDILTKIHIQQMINKGDKSMLIESFHTSLEFGTGGIRGIMGVGSNRINKYTIGMATQGIANYLHHTFPKEKKKKVAISFDSRNKSDFFADITASIFSANGIMVYLFAELHPTPLLSFAVRHFSCHCGVMITASHNPKEYNGYKAYWNDGAQVVYPHDTNIIKEVNDISLDDVKFEKKSTLIKSITKELDELYISKILSLGYHNANTEYKKNLKIVYSSIHGTGITLVPAILQRLGFENLHIVEEQASPDGNFPTVIYPNPEEREAFTLAIRKAIQINADIILTTDPDADRVGVGIKNLTGEYQLLNGNQTASLLIYYILEKLKETNTLYSHKYIVKTIVTTDLLAVMAEKYNIKCYDTLTGFKHIASLIKKLEGKEEFIAGGEESYGYLVGDFVRDKDAVASCAFIAEMAAFTQQNQIPIYQLLENISILFGLFEEKLVSFTKKGIQGQQEIQKMMDNYRKNPPRMINKSPVISIKDYLSGEEKNLQTNTVSLLELPKSDVMQLFTEDGSKISIRPSGTEPKIKIYITVREKSISSENIEENRKKLQKNIENIIIDMNLK